MKKILFTALLVATQLSFAISIKDYSPYNYEVFFTNPICVDYNYEETVYANDGTFLSGKPKNVYCTKKKDYAVNAVRESSPHFQLLKLINDKDVNEMFLTYLSFSNAPIAQALCEAVETRNLKVTFIIDSKGKARPSSRKQLDYLAKCRAKNLKEGEKANIPHTMFRGNIGGLGYAHNKIILARYKSNDEKIKIVFGSGNMSSGTILHHENWHFVTTNTKSFFSQVHYCVKDGMINHSQKKSIFKKFMKECRNDIKAEAESDITFYIVPTDGKEAMKNLVDNMKKAVSIDGAAHRITHPEIVNGLINAVADGKKVRFVVDDDIYWTGKRNVMTGSNNFMEFANVMKMVRGGVAVKYVESNQNHRLLHHNKYLVFNYADGTGAVHAGAGNFTKAAFTKNFENYYFIRIPEIVEDFRKQYNYKFTELATSYEKMPKTYVNP